MMRATDLLRLYTRMFTTRPLRTSLTILGVGIGIAAIVFLVSLGYGLQTLLLEKITTSDSLLSLDVNPPESGILHMDKRQLDIIAALPRVREVSAVADAPAQVSLGQFTGDALAAIVDPSYFRLAGAEPMVGRFPNSDDHKKVVISSTVMKLFNVKPAEVIGRVIKINVFVAPVVSEEAALAGVPAGNVTENHYEFEIIGVIENDLSSIIYLDRRDIPEIPIAEYAQTKVRVEAREDLATIRQQIKDMGFSVSALSDTIEEANKIFKAMQIILGLFGIVALLVAAIGMFNTVTISLLERTQEIGIMKAIGAANGDIFVMFLAESALMGFLGGFSGVVLGYSGAAASNFAVNLLASRFGGKQLELFAHPTWFIIGVIVFSTIVGFLTGVLPARRAARLKTLEALRYK